MNPAGDPGAGPLVGATGIGELVADRFEVAGAQPLDQTRDLGRRAGPPRDDRAPRPGPRCLAKA
jgi:hypothetical protein